MKNKAIKMLTLLLVFVLFTCVACACGDSEPKEKSIKDAIEDEVESELIAKLAYIQVTSGTSLSYRSNTCNVYTETEEELYSVSGTVTATDGSNTYTASYSGEVEYDASHDDYDVDIDLGNFR